MIDVALQRAVVLLVILVIAVDEEVAVAAGLDEQKDPVEQDRDDDQHPRHGARHTADCTTLGEVGQHQTEQGQRDDGHQIGFDPVQIEALGVVAPAAKQQGEAHQTGTHQHHYRKHGIAGHGGVGLAGQHHRGDHHHLQRDDREGEDQGAEGLAQLDGEGIGVAHDREDGPGDDGQ